MSFSFMISLISPSSSEHYCSHPDMDCPGHEMGVAETVTNIKECIKKCSDTKNCHSVFFKHKQCTLKNYACLRSELKDAKNGFYFFKDGSYTISGTGEATTLGQKHCILPLLSSIHVIQSCPCVSVGVNV